MNNERKRDELNNIAHALAELVKDGNSGESIKSISMRMSSKGTFLTVTSTRALWVSNRSEDDRP